MLVQATTLAQEDILVHLISNFLSKMQYLETIADAAFEILKEKFQYVSDQFDLNSKQHQAVKGQFVFYLQEHVLSVSTRLATIFTGGSAPAGILVFCLVLLKTG